MFYSDVNHKTGSDFFVPSFVGRRKAETLEVFQPPLFKLVSSSRHTPINRSHFHDHAHNYLPKNHRHNLLNSLLSLSHHTLIVQESSGMSRSDPGTQIQRLFNNMTQSEKNAMMAFARRSAAHPANVRQTGGVIRADNSRTTRPLNSFIAWRSEYPHSSIM